MDGDKLAKLLYLDEVPVVHVPNLDVRAWRGLIGYRRKLVGRRAAVNTQLRAHLRGLGLVAGVKGGRGLWTRKRIRGLCARPPLHLRMQNVGGEPAGLKEEYQKFFEVPEAELQAPPAAAAPQRIFRFASLTPAGPPRRRSAYEGEGVMVLRD